jgi:hypothetical protein
VAGTHWQRVHWQPYGCAEAAQAVECVASGMRKQRAPVRLCVSHARCSPRWVGGGRRGWAECLEARRKGRAIKDREVWCMVCAGG